MGGVCVCVSVKVCTRLLNTAAVLSVGVNPWSSHTYTLNDLLSIHPLKHTTSAVHPFLSHTHTHKGSAKP